MTSPHQAGPEVDAACEALAAYLDALEQGRETERAEFLARFPQLESALDCLDALERIAAHSSPNWRPVNGHAPALRR